MKNGRRFLGTDLNPGAVRIASDRLKEYGAGRAPDDLPAADQASLLDWIQEQRPELEQARISVQVVEGLTHLQELTEIERVLATVLAFLTQQRERE